MAASRVSSDTAIMFRPALDSRMAYAASVATWFLTVAITDP